MHEKSHDQAERGILDSTGKPYRTTPGDPDDSIVPADRRLELIRELGKQMRDAAFASPVLRQEETTERVQSGKFSHLINTSAVAAMHVVLIVSPSADETDPLLFWHVWISLISRGSGRPKSVEFWTSDEKESVRALLPEFLGDAGEPESLDYLRTKTAIHCTRHFTDEEMTLIGRDGL